jgi:hypothetical protein
MSRSLRRSLALVVVLAVALLAATQVSEDLTKVLVVNFPDPQRVAGAVSVEGTVRHAAFQAYREIVVPPVKPEDISRLIPAGTLVTDGFTSVVLSVGALPRGSSLRPGAVGALLVPEEEAVLRAFEEERFAQGPMEVRALPVTPAARYFASEPKRFEVAFPRYRILLYNLSDKAVSASLYAYLTY